MRTFTISKRNGKTRQIWAPSDEEKKELRRMVPVMSGVAEKLDRYRVQHGFTEGRSPLTNAKVHIGFEFTVCFDLSDFFDSVSVEHVRKAMVPDSFPIPEDWLWLLRDHTKDFFPDGYARQGLPTSPALANIAAAPMDREIYERFCVRKGRFADAPAVYSRYADDLTFSTNSRAVLDTLLKVIPEIVERHGFKINASKTKVQCAQAGRRVITGIAVDKTGAYVTRSLKRRIRAGRHQLKVGIKHGAIRRLLANRLKWKRRLPLPLRQRLQVRGLEEWAKLKLPRLAREKRGIQTWVPAAAAVASKIARVAINSAPVQSAVGYFKRKFSL